MLRRRRSVISGGESDLLNLIFGGGKDVQMRVVPARGVHTWWRNNPPNPRPRKKTGRKVHHGS